MAKAAKKRFIPEALWAASLFLLVFPIAGQAEKREVTFNGADGLALKGTLYSANNPGPGILLVNPCTANRQVYDHLAGMLNTAGYHVLTFDFHDVGGKPNRKMVTLTPDASANNIDAALNFLKSQSNVNPRALGVLASDCSVNGALRASQRHPEIRTLVLLSGGADAEGEAYIKNSSKVSILGVASEEDKDASGAIKKLVGLSANTDSQLEMLHHAGHAESMFAKQADLEPDIVVWFRSNLSVAGYGLPPAIK